MAEEAHLPPGPAFSGSASQGDFPGGACGQRHCFVSLGLSPTCAQPPLPEARSPALLLSACRPAATATSYSHVGWAGPTTRPHSLERDMEQG